MSTAAISPTQFHAYSQEKRGPERPAAGDQGEKNPNHVGYVLHGGDSEAPFMSDLRERLTAAYLTFACQMADINEIEGRRRYVTDASFYNGINLLVAVALSVVDDSDDIEVINMDLLHDNGKVPPEDDLWTAFQEGLLGS